MLSYFHSYLKSDRCTFEQQCTGPSDCSCGAMPLMCTEEPPKICVIHFVGIPGPPLPPALEPPHKTTEQPRKKEKKARKQCPKGQGNNGK